MAWPPIGLIISASTEQLVTVSIICRQPAMPPRPTGSLPSATTFPCAVQLSIVPPRLPPITRPPHSAMSTWTILPEEKSLSPRTRTVVPSETQFAMMPAEFPPAIPPMQLTPETLFSPVSVTSWMAPPILKPTTQPMAMEKSFVQLMLIFFAFRFFTSPRFMPMMPAPQMGSSELNAILEMVCPLPSKVPMNMTLMLLWSARSRCPIGCQTVPLRSISSVSAKNWPGYPLALPSFTVAESARSCSAVAI